MMMSKRSPFKRNNKLGCVLHKRGCNPINLFVEPFASGLEIQGASLYSDYYFRRVIKLLEQSESVEII